MGIKNLFIHKKADDIKLNELKEDNSLDAFLNTLSEEDKEKDIATLSDEQIYGYIKATYRFQLEVIEDMMDCAGKSLIILCNKAYKANVDSLSFNITFNGTIEGVEEEKFLFSFINKDKINTSSGIELEKEIEEDEYDENTYQKNTLLIDQKDKVLEIFHKVREVFMDKRGNDSSLLTAGLMTVFETMSSLQLETKEADLRGLIINNNTIDNTYLVNVLREENVPTFKPKARLH